MKILTLTNCPLDPKSGSGKTVLMYTSELRRGGHQVDILEPKDFEVRFLGTRGKKFRQALGAWRRVQAALQTVDYDLIEFYGDEFWLCARNLFRRQKRPLLVAHTNGLELLASAGEHAEPARDPLGYCKRRLIAPIHRSFSRQAFTHVDGFVALCQLDVAYIVDHGFLPPHRTRVIGPGLDDEFRSAPPVARQSRIAVNGSWIERKGKRVIAGVCGTLLTERPELVLDVFGTGVSPAVVREDFPAAVRERVHVHPRLSTADLAAGLRGCRAFFFPSRYEGFGLALAEAMACGCVPVTTPTGFGAEIQDGVEGFVCAFDDRAAMHSALERILDGIAFDAFSGAGRTKVANLQWAAMGATLSHVYTRWLAEKSLLSSEAPAASMPRRATD